MSLPETLSLGIEVILASRTGILGSVMLYVIVKLTKMVTHNDVVIVLYSYCRGDRQDAGPSVLPQILTAIPFVSTLVNQAGWTHFLVGFAIVPSSFACR